MIVPKVTNIPTAGILTLAGVGMRRKNFYITEVDVYQIGINLSHNGVALAKEWESEQKGKVSLAAYLMRSCKHKLATEVTVSATLRFCRQVTKDQFLNAFDEAFKGCSPDAVAEFRSTMGSAMSTGVVAKGDDVSLFWLDNGEMAFALNGVLGDRLTNRELNQRLLEVYIDPARTVSKELYTCIETHIKDLDA